MQIDQFIRAMPKVELHVHLEGSVRPATLLKLAKRHGVSLPANDEAGLSEWYQFRDFPHFVEIYVAISKCLRTPEDIELVAREFLEGQKDQNILHSEVTYTASTIEKYMGMSWSVQETALRKAIEYGESELGISMKLILDIVRGDPPERALEVANWAVGSDLVGALGLAGEERLGASGYESAFSVAKDHGLPIIPHAGETEGPQSIWEALEKTDPVRIGHGVRCLEDPELVREIKSRRIPLELCPSSNVSLGVFRSLKDYPLVELMEEGLILTINSDDPPMFSSSLTEEFLRVQSQFELSKEQLTHLTLNATRHSLLAEERKQEILEAIAVFEAEEKRSAATK